MFHNTLRSITDLKLFILTFDLLTVRQILKLREIFIKQCTIYDSAY